MSLFLLTQQQDAAQVNEILGNVKAFLRSNEEVARNVDYKVSERGQNERARLANLLTYTGPDPDTLDVLEQNYERWSCNPFIFWAAIQSPYMGELASQADVVRCFIRSTRADA